MPPLSRLRLPVVLAVGLCALTARAEPVQGVGRITAVAGYRWVPNWYFIDRADQAGFPVTQPSYGGPSLVVSFALGALPWLELSLDGFIAYDGQVLSQVGVLSALTYGGVATVRLTTGTLLRGVVPFIGPAVGPTLAYIFGEQLRATEKLLLGAGGVAGVHIFLTPRWALTVEVRYLYARAFVPGISGMNVGGLTLSVGVSTFVPPAPDRPPDLPGFTSPSRL